MVRGRDRFGRFLKRTARKVKAAFGGKRKRRSKGLARAASAGLARGSVAKKVDVLMKVAVNHEHRLRHVESKVDSLASAISRLA